MRICPSVDGNMGHELREETWLTGRFEIHQLGPEESGRVSKKSVWTDDRQKRNVSHFSFTPLS